MSEALDAVRRELGIPTPPPATPPTPRPPVPPRGGSHGWAWMIVLTIVAVAVFAYLNSSPGSPAANGTPKSAKATGTAREQLDALVAADSDRIEANYAGSWVPQLSSVAIGNGSKPGKQSARAILRRQQRLAARFNALLLRSDSYAYKFGGYYVSIAPIGFPSYQGALQWCRSNNLGSADCYAKLLTHDRSITPNAMHL